MRKYILLPIALMLAFGAQIELKASIAGLTGCTQQSLANYRADFQNQAAGCTISGSGGTLQYFDFTFAAFGAGANPNLGSITVDPVGTGGRDIGFVFDGFYPGFATGPSDSPTYEISYWYQILGDPPTSAGAEIGMDPVSGHVNIGQTTCPDGQFAGCPSVFIDNLTTPELFSIDACSAAFLRPPCYVNSTDFLTTGFAHVLTVISMGPNSSFDSFSSLSPVFPPSAVPEPGMLALTLAGAVAIGLARRYVHMR